MSVEFNPHRKGFIAEINVTPFVDVMLVLLVIFMVTAPMLTQGVEVDLPKTKTVESLPQESDVVVLTVKKDGKIFIEKYEVPEGDLRRHLERLVAKPKKTLFLQADQAVAYGVVVRVMAEIKAAGIEQLGVVAEEEAR